MGGNRCTVLVIPGRRERLATRNAMPDGEGRRIFQDGSRFMDDDNLVQGVAVQIMGGREIGHKNT